jgi:foldase protein PrsA
MRSTTISLSLSLWFLAAACSGSRELATAAGAGPEAAVAALDADVAALAARAEHDADAIEVQHVLIAFQGAPKISGVTRSLDDAHRLAAEVYARAKQGEDFTALMKEFSNDSGPGRYPMTKATRSGMVKGFGDVGWRLAVGEIGVAPHDSKASPYGWHVIKRLK